MKRFGILHSASKVVRCCSSGWAKSKRERNLAFLEVNLTDECKKNWKGRGKTGKTSPILSWRKMWILWIHDWKEKNSPTMRKRKKWSGKETLNRRKTSPRRSQNICFEVDCWNVSSDCLLFTRINAASCKTGSIMVKAVNDTLDS